MHGYSRRTFITRSTLVAGVGLLWSPSISGLYGAQHAGKKLGVALVGLGGYATRELAPALQLSKHCELVGVVSGTESKRKAWQEKYNLPSSNIYSYDTFDEIAKNDAIDIVYIVLPNSMHAVFTIRAAAAGKHVICEKPMAMNAAECRRMIQACEKKNVSLSIGCSLQFDPFVPEIRRQASVSPMGEPNVVVSDFSFAIGDLDQWRLRKVMSGGGAVMDLGVYCIQAARSATGEEPIAITAQEFKTDGVKFAQVDETVTWQLEFPSGAVCHSTTSYAGRFNRLLASYEKGRAEMEPVYRYRGLAGSVNGKPMEFAPVSQQAQHMDAVAAAILSGEQVPVDGYEGLRDLRIIDALYQSLATGGKRVEITKG